MGDNFTLYIHYRGKVITSKTGFRKYVRGSIKEFKDIDPDKFSKEEVKDLLTEIGISKEDVDDVFYSVSVIKFDEGLRDFKTDMDALKVVELASKGYDVHVFVTHKGNLVQTGNVNNEVTMQLDNDDSIGLEYTKNGVTVDMNMESRLEENAIESDLEEDGDNVIGEEDDVDDLPDMYDPDYGDPSGENLWNISQQSEDVNKFHDSNLNIETQEVDRTQNASKEPVVMFGEQIDEPTILFGDQIDDISDSDGEGQQELFINTPEQSEDDEEPHKTAPRHKNVEFRRQTDMSNPKFIVGMLFKDHKEFVEAVKNYKISNNYSVRAAKQESQRVLFRCVPNCPWRLYASWNTNLNAMVVKTFIDEHKCSKAYHSRMVTSRWVAIKMMDKIRRDPNYKISEIVEDIKTHYEVQITMTKAARARKLARLMVGDNFEDQYKRVRDYGHELLRTNPGSTVKIDYGNPCRDFKRFYLCLAACKKAFLLHCRPVISVDACHLRGPITGQLLSAVGIDANDGMYPIAFAVAEGETKKTWEWFFNNLLQDIGPAKENGWVFYSDQQKGLVPALNTVFPGVRHRLCVRHLYANFKKTFKGLTLKEMMERAARETTEVGFERIMAQIKVLDANAEAHLRGIDPQLWCKHTFSAYPKCDMLLNNLAECFNSKIIKARDKPVITCIETIRRYIMTRIHRNRDSMVKYHGPICPRIQDKLEKNKKDSLKWEAKWNGINKYEVSRGKEVYVVDVKNRTCRCYKWDITGIPCEHACAAIYQKKDNCENYVDDYLSKEAFVRTYSMCVEPVNGEDFWPNAGGLPILSPKIKVQPGRPRLNKRKKYVDEPNDPTKLSRKGTKIHCAKCGQEGHNKRPCKSVVPNTQQENNEAVNTNEKRETNAAACVSKKRKKTKGQSKGVEIDNTNNGVYVESSRGSKGTNAAASVGMNQGTVIRMGFKVPVDKPRRRSYKKKICERNRNNDLGQGSGIEDSTVAAEGSQILSQGSLH